MMQPYHKALYTLNSGSVGLGLVSAAIMIDTSFMFAVIGIAISWMLYRWLYMSPQTFTETYITYKLRAWYLWALSIGVVLSEYGIGIMTSNLWLIGIGLFHMVSEAAWLDFIVMEGNKENGFIDSETD